MTYSRTFRRFPPPLRKKLRLTFPILSTTLILLLLLLLDPQQPHPPSPTTPQTLLHKTLHTTTTTKPPKILPGVSIVAACRNRHSTLRQTLKTWINAEDVDEVVVVDWGSEPPLREVIEDVVGRLRKGKMVRVVRVEGENGWILSRAFNLGVEYGRFDSVVRLDCDYGVDKGFVGKHWLGRKGDGVDGGGGMFYAGNYGKARDENEVHLNGAVVIRRSDFWKVGGYDERIQTYGWDDEDLYGRLGRVGGLKKVDVDFGVIRHVEHGDGVRNGGGSMGDGDLVQVEIDLNALLLGKLKAWDGAGGMKSRYVVVGGDERKGYVAVKASRVPKSLKEQVSSVVYRESWDLALGRRLNNDYQVPWDVLAGIEVPVKESLLKGLMRRVVKDGPKPRALFVHCQHGLGNRLRALGSAMAFAKNTNRELVVVWEKDAHIQAGFRDLFANRNLHVMNTWGPKWPFTDMHQWDASWNSMKWYNYMEMEKQGAIKGEKIVNVPDKHMYYKGAYIMEVDDPKLTNWEVDNEMLRTLEPVVEVQQRIQQHINAGLKNCVGVHIRNRTLSRDIKNVNFDSEYGSDAAQTMDYWRRKSGYQSFIDEMRKISTADPSIKFYVATDTVDVIPILEQEFPGKILHTPRHCDDRDGVCVRYALTDVYALAKTKYILGSNWSSFTEAAQRIGGIQAKLAGQDFAADSPHLRKL